MILHVAAAAIVDESKDRVLLAQRPGDKHQGGKWEFPGGKVEAGEDIGGALARELDEELGIHPTAARPLIRVTHHYPERSVLLDVWRVTSFNGEPHGREGQPVEWVDIGTLREREFPAANVPIVRAVSLPDRYLITPSPADFPPQVFLDALSAAIERGSKLLQLRGLPVGADDLAVACRQRAHAAGAKILLNGEPDDAVRLGFDGVHLNGRRLRATDGRPLSPPMLVGVSCHDRDELTKAADIDADFALLSPVRATPTHPDAEPLGWERFRALADEAVIPVYALGGVGPGDLERVWCAGGQGVAAIRGLWGAAYRRDRSASLAERSRSQL